MEWVLVNEVNTRESIVHEYALTFKNDLHLYGIIEHSQNVWPYLEPDWCYTQHYFSIE